MPGTQKKGVEAAQTAARKYVNERTSLLDSMLSNYIDSDGTYDFQSDLDRLAESDVEFRTSVTPFVQQIPQITEFPEVMANTALPIPEFARSPTPQPSPDVSDTGDHAGAP